SGRRQVLELGVRQVDHLDDVVPGRHLFKILVGEGDRYGAVGQKRIRAGVRGDYLQSGIQLQVRSVGDVTQLETVNRRLHEVVPTRRSQLGCGVSVSAIHTRSKPGAAHARGTYEADGGGLHWKQ